VEIIIAGIFTGIIVALVLTWMDISKNEKDASGNIDKIDSRLKKIECCNWVEQHKERRPLAGVDNLCCEVWDNNYGAIHKKGIHMPKDTLCEVWDNDNDTIVTRYYSHTKNGIHFFFYRGVYSKTAAGNFYDAWDNFSVISFPRPEEPVSVEEIISVKQALVKAVSTCRDKSKHSRHVADLDELDFLDARRDLKEYKEKINNRKWRTN